MKLTVGKGIDKYISNLEELLLATDGQIKMAIYDGTKIIAEEVARRIKAMPVQDKYAEYVTGIRSVQKKGLEVGFGIARMKKEGDEINTKLGFDGYNKQITKKYPKGQPNAMIARTFESGNSFTQKIPFIAPAVRAKRQEAEKKMAEVIDETTAKIMK